MTPVVLFVYNRPLHTKEVLQSLSDCMYAKEVILYIFSDAPKNEKAVETVQQVRSIIADEKWKNCFHEVIVIEAEKNKGLATSVITGVTQVVDKHGQVVVIEDDNRVAKDFIDYMRRGLEFYRDNPQIGSIGAFKIPFALPKDYQHDVFLMGRSTSYAWATWKDRWDLIDWDVSDYETFRNNRKERARFDEYGADRSHMLDAQMQGRIDSWAIRFSYAMFKHNLFAILPVQTRVENTGFDGTGVHNGKKNKRFIARIDPDMKPAEFENVELDLRIKKRYAAVFKPSFKGRIKRFVKLCFGIR